MQSNEVGTRKLRTRKELLRAAARLIKEGASPTLEDVAREALVSRATVYRYFSSIDELLVEAPIDEAVPDASQLFASDDVSTPEERIDRAESVMHRTVYENEMVLRHMLSHSITRAIRQEGSAKDPVRQNRRTAYIDEALAPHRKKFDPKTYSKLRSSLALIFGTESMIVCRDVLALPQDEAREVKSWAVRVLVRAAMEESNKSKKSKRK
ncbi:MAG: TetR/AcrR family transcriptional regulator [Deltaproteobacteria bacterium]|nr:TetR/AcrR family transcriptional regulator [Deltaproteobacteria bacterium]